MVGIVLAAVAVVATGAALIFATVAVVDASGSQSNPFSDEALDPSTPLGLLGTNLAIAVILPAVLLTVLVVHRQRPGFLSSVAGRLRWPFLRRLLVLGLALSITSYVGTLLLSAGDDAAVHGPHSETLLALLAVIALTTPLQAAAEEYGFRGYLTQAISSWFRGAGGAAFAAVVTAASFAVAHGVQDAWLFGDRMAFGLVASWLAWRTGGLEAPIALHVSNNLVALTSAAVTGSLPAALTSTSLEPHFALVDVVTMLVFAGLADRLAKRHRVAVVSDPSAVGYPGKRLERSASADGWRHWGMG